MDVIIQSLGFKAGAELESFVTEKVNKLEKRAPGVVRANVVLFLGPETQTDNKHCDIRLEMPGNDPFVKKNAATWENAIMEAVDTLDNVLRRAKEKMQEKRP
ncbi:MAG TPA: HPF/RaiA family ribosome-associated protein [Flavipsychrobacter sp.]|nr:HPF/RaiA family ribosome-associated protein [Flavipsychrobacter sp.]